MKKLHRKGICFIGAVIIVLSMAINVQAAQPIKMKIGHPHLTIGTSNSAAVLFAEEVKKNTGGEIEIAVHGASSLGKERYMMEQLQTGALEFVVVGAQMMEIFVPQAKVIYLPGLFKNYDHIDNAVAQNSPLFNRYSQLVTKQNMVVTAFGGHQIYNFLMKKKPIYKVDDIRGMKIRVPESATMIEGVRALGAVPVTVAWGEVYTALQLGTVDGGGVSIPNTYDMKFYEVCERLSIYPLFPMTHILLASGVQWKKWTPKQQQVIMEAAKKWGNGFSNGTPDGHAGYVWMAKYGVIKLIEKGMTINAVSEPKAFDDKVLVYTNKVRKEDPIVDEMCKLIEATKY